MSKPAVPAFAARWQPPPPGTVMQRQRVFAPAKGAKRDPYENVEVDFCSACGHRFGETPTRCDCIGSTPRRAPPKAVPRHWTER